MISRELFGVDLFGVPPIDPRQSQFFTPMWVARRLAKWIPPTHHVLEPSAGSGNLIAALLERGHPVSLITAVEQDPRWAEYLTERFPGLPVYGGNFFGVKWQPGTFFDVCLMNPPYEGNLHCEFVGHALGLAREVIGVFPCSFEFTQERDALLWATKARVTHRVRFPERLDFGGDESGKQDSVALRIVARRHERKDELAVVSEEVWRKGDAWGNA